MNRTEEKRDIEWLGAWSNALAGCDVLELGCGSGLDTLQLERQAASVTCSDIVRRAEKGSKCHFVQLDHSVYLPFSKQFDVVVASLCLHYFSWELTAVIVRDIRRVLLPGGLLICRVNSTSDKKYGAAGYPEIEAGLYDVDGLCKRFFDEDDIVKLFDDGWVIDRLEHKRIDRYEEPKWVWEFGARSLTPYYPWSAG